MPIGNRSKPWRLAFVLPLLVMACSKEPEASFSEAGILAYVPGDTPYVFAALETAPDEITDKLGKDAARVAQAYARLVKAAINEPPPEGQEPALDPEARERLSAMIDELAALVTPEGLPEAGIDRNSTMVIYGVGLLPVLRITLSDPAKFESVFGRMEARAGKEMSVATIEGHEYRYAGNDNGRVIVTVLDDQLVVTLAPTSLEDDLLKRLLGLTLPEQSIADTDELAALAKSYGFTSYGLGLIDVGRIAATFLDEQAGVNGALLALMEHDHSTLSDVCRQEVREISGVVPRFVTGYTEMSAERIRSNSVFELRNDIATGLKKVTAPVPGLGQQHDGLLSFGMSFNIPALREFYSARLEALDADPFECEMFADLQAGVAQGRQALQQPLPPFANEFRGFLAIIDDIKGMDFETRQPPTDIDMRFLISTGNAQGLVAMGAMFVPQIAALDLKPDSTPVKIDLPQTGAPIDAAWVAMSEDAIALSVGEGMEGGLSEMLAARTVEPAPFMSMNMDAGRYYGFLGDALAQAQAEPDDSGKQASPEIVAATGEVMRSFEDMFERVSMDVQFTERGIEMPSTMVLAE